MLLKEAVRVLPRLASGSHCIAQGALECVWLSLSQSLEAGITGIHYPAWQLPFLALLPLSKSLVFIYLFVFLPNL